MTEQNIRETIKTKAKDINAHQFSIEALCKGFDTDVHKGLTEEQAKENLKRFGPNKSKNMPECTMVKRDGEYKRIMTEDLVPGDIIRLQGDTGNFSDICGDIRIVEILEPLHVESYFLYKDCLNYLKEMTAEKTSDDPLETNNLIFHGTSVFAGSCVGMVFQTGESLLLGDVSSDLLVTPALADSSTGESLLLGDVTSDLLVTPALADSSDDEEDEEKRGFMSSVGHGIINMFRSKKEDEMPERMTFTFHEDTLEKICEMFNTDVAAGLTTEQVAINQAKSGKNSGIHVGRQNLTMCKRDGQFQNILSKRLTLGDIISLKAPQIIPADIRIVEASPDCKVDKSGLTGDSEPRKMSTEKTHENPLESENVAFASTKLVMGNCTGIVVSVGMNTIIGGCPAPQPFPF